MTFAKRISKAGRIRRMTNMLINAPRLIRRHRLRISSILEVNATLAVATKKVSPLVRMLWLHCSTAIWADSLTECPRFGRFTESGCHQNRIIYRCSQLNGSYHDAGDKRKNGTGKIRNPHIDHDSAFDYTNQKNRNGGGTKNNCNDESSLQQ